MIDLKAELIHGFSNKTRLEILETIKESEKTVSEIVDAVAGNQSSSSQHLAGLRGCGVIVRRQEGNYVYYKLRHQKVADLMNMLDEVLDEVDKDISSCESHISEEGFM